MQQGVTGLRFWVRERALVVWQGGGSPGTAWERPRRGAARGEKPLGAARGNRDPATKRAAGARAQGDA